MQEWINQPYGGKVVSKNGNGWVYLLYPTPELWTLVLRHRTQILYLADIATVCCQMDLRPGSIVLESGTGSGSLTTSLARAVGPSGHIYTFEFHEQRAQAAAEEFERNGLKNLVTTEQRNIEDSGFPETLHGKADAVFLDLPGPWKAIPSAAKCLRPDGVFCGFSPCIEQVQKTCEALNANGFRDFRTIEVLLREYDVSGEKAVGGVETLEDMLLQQLQGDKQGGGRGKKARVEEREGQTEKGPGTNKESLLGNIQGEETIEGGEAAEGSNVGAGENMGGNESAAARQQSSKQQQRQRQEKGGDDKKTVLARPISQGRGHTGYLTFARKCIDVEL